MEEKRGEYKRKASCISAIFMVPCNFSFSFLFLFPSASRSRILYRAFLPMVKRMDDSGTGEGETEGERLFKKVFLRKDGYCVSEYFAMLSQLLSSLLVFSVFMPFCIFNLTLIFQYIFQPIRSLVILLHFLLLSCVFQVGKKEFI